MPTNDFLSPYGAPKYSEGAALKASVATLTALKALEDGGPARVHGNEVLVDADGSRFYFHSTSTLTGDDVLVVTPSDAPTAGRWLRCAGVVDLALPFSYATTDGATLLTIPTGARLQLVSAHWEITADMTGGASSAIGVDSSVDTTAGDILGGASGDVAAALTAGIRTGTVGAKMDTDTELHAQILVAGATLRFQRITSAFTAGSGYVHVVGFLLRNPGA